MSFDKKFLDSATACDTKLGSLLENDEIDTYSVKVKQRSGKRQSVTKTISSLENKAPSNINELKFAIKKLTSLRAELDKLNSEIEVHMLSNSSLSGNDYEKFTDTNDGYSDRIDLKLCELEGNLEQMVRPAVRASPQNSVNQPVGLPNLELPQLELPKFNGKPERYSSFMKSLEDILNKFNLTEFERYSYLRQQVSGPARQIVNSLPTDNLTFTAAKQLLYNAFSDKTT